MFFKNSFFFFLIVMSQVIAANTSNEKKIVKSGMSTIKKVLLGATGTAGILEVTVVACPTVVAGGGIYVIKAIAAKMGVALVATKVTAAASIVLDAAVGTVVVASQALTAVEPYVQIASYCSLGVEGTWLLGKLLYPTKEKKVKEMIKGDEVKSFEKQLKEALEKDSTKG